MNAQYYMTSHDLVTEVLADRIFEAGCVGWRKDKAKRRRAAG
jgi:hypothetical protein